MNDDPGPSRVRLQHGNTAASGIDGPGDSDIPLETATSSEHTTTDRTLRAKKQRTDFLDQLARDLDATLFFQFIAIYYLDCSFFWFIFRALVQLVLLTPVPELAIPDLSISRLQDENKPSLPTILVLFFVSSFLHTTWPAPSAGEDTRGYLHGGFMIDFIGQEGPTSKITLVGLDVCVLMLQMVMASVHVKRRELKRRSINAQQVASVSRIEDGSQTNPGQDTESEERGVLRQCDRLVFGLGTHVDEEDSLLHTAVDEMPGRDTDLLDALATGQVVIADLDPVSALRQEYSDYRAQPWSVGQSGESSAFSPSTLHQLNTIRMRFGAGGG